MPRRRKNRFVGPPSISFPTNRASDKASQSKRRNEPFEFASTRSPPELAMRQVLESGFVSGMREFGSAVQVDLRAEMLPPARGSCNLEAMRQHRSRYAKRSAGPAKSRHLSR